MNEESQGALEHLIIVAAILAIASVVIVIVAGAFGGGQERAKLSAMKQDAAKCAQQISMSGEKLGEPHPEICEDVCSEWQNQDGYSEGTFTQVTTKAVPYVSSPYEACLAGKADWIRLWGGTGFLLYDNFNGNDVKEDLWGVGGQRISEGYTETYLKDGKVILNVSADYTDPGVGKPDPKAWITSLRKFNYSKFTFRAKFSNTKYGIGGYWLSEKNMIIFDTGGGNEFLFIRKGSMNPTYFELIGGEMVNKWHTYQIIREESKISFYIDDELRGEYEGSIATPEYVKVTLNNPGTVEVDWVRVESLD